MTDSILARAKSAIGKKTIYRLGRGGMKPERDRPSNSEGMCDCSGFIAWCCGISRQCTAISGGWIETTIIVRDATGPQALFRKLPAPVPGCLAVFGDCLGRQGHVAVVTKVVGSKPDRVIHCSASSFRNTGDAILETAGTVFTKNPRTIYVEFIGSPVAHA